MPFQKVAHRVNGLIEDDDAGVDVRAVVVDGVADGLDRQPEVQALVEVADSVAPREFAHQSERVAGILGVGAQGNDRMKASIERPAPFAVYARSSRGSSALVVTGLIPCTRNQRRVPAAAICIGTSLLPFWIPFHGLTAKRMPACRSGTSLSRCGGRKATRSQLEAERRRPETHARA